LGWRNRKLEFFKKDPLEDSFMRLAENELYEIVTREVMNEQVVAGIWGRAFSDAEGATDKSKALYIKYRVQDLKDRSIVELAKSENLKRERPNLKYESKPNDDLTPLIDEEEQELIKLIYSLRNKNISVTTEEELDEMLEDFSDGAKFAKMDLRYLRALNARL
jgi:hypothetical protein